MNIEPSLTDSLAYTRAVEALREYTRVNYGDGRIRGGSVSLMVEIAHVIEMRDAYNEIAERLVDEAAKQVADRGSSMDWTRVGRALGATKQAASQAHKRWLARQS